MTNVVLIGMVFVLACMLGYALSYYMPPEEPPYKHEWGDRCYTIETIPIKNTTITIINNNCNV